jgi:hypothetical protein
MSVAAGDSPHGRGYVGWGGVIAAMTLIGLLAASLAYMLVAFFPIDANTKRVVYFGAAFNLSHDTALFVMVLSAGGMGGCIHGLRSLTWYFGHADLRHRWMLMYCSLPFVGALLALIFYLLLRGGLLSAQTTGNDVNAYGFAAIGALVGLFSAQAAQMLLKVFSTIFSTVSPGSDSKPAPS